MATAYASSSSEDDLDDIDHPVPEAKTHFGSLDTDAKLPSTTEFLAGVPGSKLLSGRSSKQRIEKIRQRSHGLAGDMPLANRKYLPDLFPTFTPEEQEKYQRERYHQHPNIFSYVQQMWDIMREINLTEGKILLLFNKTPQTGHEDQGYEMVMKIWNHVRHLLSIKNFCAPKLGKHSHGYLNRLEDTCLEFGRYMEGKYGKNGENVRDFVSSDSEEGRINLLRWALDVAGEEKFSKLIRKIGDLIFRFPTEAELPVQKTHTEPVPIQSMPDRRPPLKGQIVMATAPSNYMLRTEKCSNIGTAKLEGTVYNRGFWAYALYMALIGDQLEDMFEWITGEDCELIMTSKTARELWNCIWNHVQQLLNIFHFIVTTEDVKSDPELGQLMKSCNASNKDFLTTVQDQLTSVEDYKQSVLESADSLKQICSIIRRKMPDIVKKRKQVFKNFNENICKKWNLPYLDASELNTTFRKIQQVIRRARPRTNEGNPSTSSERKTRSGIKIPTDNTFLHPPIDDTPSEISKPIGQVRNASSPEVYATSAGIVSVSTVSAENATPPQRERSRTHILNSPSPQMQLPEIYGQTPLSPHSQRSGRHILSYGETSQSPLIQGPGTHIQIPHHPQMQMPVNHVQYPGSPQTSRSGTHIQIPHHTQIQMPINHVQYPGSPKTSRSGTHIQIPHHTQMEMPVNHVQYPGSPQTSGTHIQNPHHTQIQNHAQGSPQTSRSGIYVQNYGSPQTPRYVTHGQNSPQRQISGQRLHAQSRHYPQMSPSGVHHGQEHRYSHISRSDISRQNPQHGMYAQNPQLSQFPVQSPQIPLSPSSSSHGMFDHVIQPRSSSRNKRQY